MSMSDRQNEIIELDNGIVVGTGCWEREERLSTNVMAAYRDVGPMLTWDQIRTIASNPSRISQRQQFPSTKYIWNQGQTGSCNAYAAAGALARLRHLSGFAYVEFGPEGAYAQINGGRDQGSALSSGMKWVTDHGMTLREHVPHGEYRKSRIPREAYAHDERFRWDECLQLGDDNEWERELASGLVSGFFGVVAVQANRDYGKMDRNGVILPTDGRGNHAVGVGDVRFVDDEPQYDQIGSWGTDIHDGGYAWLTARKHLKTTRHNHAFYLARVALPDPHGVQVP